MPNAREDGVATPIAWGGLTREGEGREASPSPGQAAHPSPAAAEAAPAAAAFPPLEVAWILALLEWTDSEDIMFALRAKMAHTPKPGVCLLCQMHGCSANQLMLRL